ncbi:MHC class II transactivator [Trichomycterus rosablanca]|uniref:MHC class II transactivator n=1 Tax=Trichomycterus rosablanca TaxID=2290929 RepID=UPI002F35F6CB
MVPFQEVLAEVRRFLQEANPDLLLSLFNQLLEARIFSEQYYQSLFDHVEGNPEDESLGDLDDLARRLALPVWQNWDTSKGILFSAFMEKEPDFSDFYTEPEDFSVDGDLWGTIDNNLLDCLGFSSGFDPETYLDSSFCDDVFDTLPDGSEEKSIFAFEEENPAVRKSQTRKRRGKCCETASKRGPRPKRNRKAPSSKPPSDVIMATLDGIFQISVPASEPPVVQTLTISTASLMPSGAPTMQIIQTINHLSPPVINSILPVGPTYVLVSPQSLTPVPQIAPPSPANAAVAPLELSTSTYPVSSSSESASQRHSPSPPTTVTVVSPSKDKTTSKEFSPTSRQTKTTPVIPKHVEDYIQGLKSHLRETCSRMDGGRSMETHYVDTQLVRRMLIIRTGKNANKCLEKELVVLSNSERKKSTVQRNHVFQNSGSNSKHLITVLGKAGMGKSVFIQRLTLDWSSDDLPQFQFVFLLNCKVLNLTQPNYSLKTLLFESSACPPCRNENSSAVFQHVRASPEKVLIVFDSFDDMKDLEGLLQSPATSEMSQNYSVRQLFSGLFQKKILSGCTLLIASRPKDVLNQLLRKVDSILEVSGFSSKDIELYTAKYFADSSQQDKAPRKIKSQKYIFSLCSNPLLCQVTCSLVEHHDSNLNALPSSLTDLFQQVLSQNLELNNDIEKSKPDLTQLCNVAWEGIKTHSTLFKHNQTISKDLLDYGLDSGILMTHAGQNSDKIKDTHYANLFMQNFLGALCLVNSNELNDKTLLSQTVLHQRKRKSQGEWQDVLQRFVIGLLFQKNAVPCCRILHTATDLQAKRKAVEVQLENLKPGTLSSSRLLEVFHCVYEARNVKLAKLLVKNLTDDLSFSGAQLSPVDAYVVWHILKCTKGLKRALSIDLRDTCVPLTGLKDLVALDCVKSFRAPTMDTINLWEDLQSSDDKLTLKRAIEKFTIDPIKVSQVCHVEDLGVLVQIHKEKKLPSCEADPALEGGIPAVRNLHKLEYELGQQNGPEAFLKLVGILPALESLQYLDIEKNKIGDAGATKLAGVLKSLSSLKMLNLSQNCIGDAGVENLAEAMAFTSSLQNLSLYGNLIADRGAESLASVLPLMKSLLDLDVKYNKFTDAGAEKLTAALKSSPWMKSLDMWNDCIPYGVFEHLQLQDSRIKAL